MMTPLILQTPPAYVATVETPRHQTSWMKTFQSEMPPLPVDILSNAEPEKVVTTHLIWDVEADFQTKSLRAAAKYTFLNKQSENNRLILDVRKLNIDRVLVNNKEVKTTLQLSHTPAKPDGLVIPIPANVGTGTLTIQYRTSPEASGIFWIDKQFTEGKMHPLVYTLFEQTEGASAIPGQHTPQVRLTYEVNVKTGSRDLMALSSVMNNPLVRNESGQYLGMTMPRPVPLYLLSLHVGNFSHRTYEADPRTGVYAEDAMIESTAQSFSNLPQILKVAEEICGPYNWRVYSPIILCWAFPFAAMEHPCASTCGAIVRERSTVVPHELAHSWAGNDTTNSTWQQFFWNEGFTTFFEVLICEKIWGADFAHLSFLNTLEAGRESMNRFRKTKPDAMRLCAQTADFETSIIPYAKGALFFFMLRDAIGKTDFDKFVKDYMAVFYANSMSDLRFLAFLKLWLLHEKNIHDFDRFNTEHQIDEWLYGTEIPSNAPIFHSKLTKIIEAEKAKVVENKPLDVPMFHGWNTETQIAFLNQFLENGTLSQLAFLDSQLKLTQSNKMSILGAWSHLCAKKGYLTKATREMMIEYVIKRNSMYEANKVALDLSKTPEGREVIQTILTRGKNRLFTITRETLEKTLGSVKS